MKCYQFVRPTILTLLLASLVLAAPASADPRSDWTAFRKEVPFHAQVIALGAPDVKGRRTLVIAEPPPWVRLDSFNEAFRDRVFQAEVMQHSMGFDGWVKDIACVAQVRDELELQALVRDLSRFLYGTSYKAYAVDIGNIAASNEAKGGYDLTVSSFALRKWLGAQPAPRSSTAVRLNMLSWVVVILTIIVLLKTRHPAAITILTVASLVCYFTRATPPPPSEVGALRPLHGGGATSVDDLLKSPSPGVYLSEQPGLVALVLRREFPLHELVVPLREFALDSDLILGAIGSSAGVVVVGRERQVPVTMLPPLRAETLVQLAAAGKDELSQSYERLNLFAGKTQNGDDWAPIFLSPELRDTEYGSLLNITDQLLKGWSEHGEVDYENFPYPKPSAFPFETGLLEASKTGQVTYNWNTKGVGYADSSHGYEVVAFGRTGALPVDYLGETDERMRGFEDRGYDYFAGVTGDPNLARVVQYAGLYQVWRHFNVHAVWPKSDRSHDGPEALLPLVRNTLQQLRSFPADMLPDLPETADDGMKAAVEEFRGIHRALNDEYAADDALEPLVKALVRPREAAAAAIAASDEAGIAQVTFARAISRNEGVRQLIGDLTGLAGTLYAASDSKDDPAGWIKTPSIVLSRRTGKFAGQMTGGHNLSSRVTRTMPDEALVPGAVRVVDEGGERVLRYHPADADKMRAAVRSAARNIDEDPSAVKAIVEDALRQAGRDTVSIREALKLTPRPEGLGRGFHKSAGVHVSESISSTHAVDVPSSHTGVLSALREEGRVEAIVIERTNSGAYRVSRSGAARTTEVEDSAAALDIVSDAAGRVGDDRVVHLHFIGMDEAQAGPFAQVGELHLGRPGRTRVLRASVGRGEDDIAVIGHIRNGRWDTTRKTVSVTPRAEGNTADVVVHVPESGTVRRLSMHFQIRMKRGLELTQRMLANIERIVTDVIDSMGSTFDAMLAARRIKSELLKIEPSLAGMSMRLEVESKEIIITHHVQATTESTAN